jgi:HlyD family secretion protein
MQTTKRSVKKIPLTIIIVLIIAAVAMIYLTLRQKPASAQSSAESGVVEQITVVDSVEVNGIIEPFQSAEVYWKTSGTVAEVNVEEGELVKVGDVLMTLDPTSAPGSVTSAQTDLSNARKSLSDLYTNANMSRVQAQQSIADYAKAVRDAQYQLENYNVPTDQAALEPMEAMDKMKEKLDQAWSAFEPYMYYPETNSTREDLKDELDSAQSDYDAAVKRVQYVNKLEAAEANLEKARLDYAKWQKGSDPEELAIVEARIATADATLRQLQIIAPFNGEALAVNYQPGDVVISNLAAASVVNRTDMFVEVKIDESDFSKVRSGNPAIIALDALPGMELAGKVISINPLGEMDQGIVKYTVRVELNRINESVNIPLGATADVTIQNGNPKLGLALPIRAIQNDAQGEYVNRIGTDGNIQRVDVTSGDIVGDLVIVIGDLQAGERVLLGQTAQTGPGGGGMFGGN